MSHNMTTSPVHSQVFNAWNQTVTFLDRDGQRFHVTIRALDNYRIYLARSAISYGTQVGASVLLFAILLLLTKADKRKSAIFFLNASSLLLNAIRCILFVCTFTSSTWNPYSQMSGEFDNVTNMDINLQTVANLLALIVATLIMISLTLQVWIICINVRRLRRIIIMIITCTLGLVSTGFKIATVIMAKKENRSRKIDPHFNSFSAMSSVIQAVAMWVFSLVFTCKLGYAVMQRRKLNMTQFGPMQVIFIMSCQTMVVPALFTTLRFIHYKGFPILATVNLTIMCIFIPLSAIWAGIVDENRVAGNDLDSVKRLVQGQFHQFNLSTAVTDRKSANWSDKSNRTASTGLYWKGREAEIAAAGHPSMQNMDFMHANDAHIARDVEISRGNAANSV